METVRSQAKSQAKIVKSHPSSPLLRLDTTGDFAALHRRGMLYVDKTEAIIRLTDAA